MSEKAYTIGPDGEITTLYADDLKELGEVQSIERASMVEPDANGQWYVQLSDSKLNGEHAGQCIGSGFETRGAALAFEEQWLAEHVLCPASK